MQESMSNWDALQGRTWNPPSCCVCVRVCMADLLVGSRPIHLKLPIPVLSSDTRVSNMRHVYDTSHL